MRVARARVVGTALLLASAGLGWRAAAGAEGKIPSGPPVGARCKPFTVQAVTGPQKGQRLCYI